MNKLFKKLFAPIAVLSLALGVTISISNQKDVVGAEAATQTWQEVTVAPTDWSGQYLIVSKTDNVAFNGSLATLDAVSNTIAVTISAGQISLDDSYSFTISAHTGGNYDIKSASGQYIYNTSSGSNALLTSTTIPTATNTISLSTNKVIILSSNYLVYNSTSDQTRFRYYKAATSDSGQGTGSYHAISLYKKVEATDRVTALTVSPSAKSYYTSSTLMEADFAVSVTKNGSAGTSADYNVKIGTGTAGSFSSRASVVWGTTKPLATDTIIQFEANYPDSDGTTYLKAYVNLTVTAPLLQSIAVTTQPTKKVYNTNDLFDPTGMVVTASYNNGASQTISNSSLSFSPSPLTVGTTTVTISYTEGSVTKTTTVSGLSVTTPTSYVATLSTPVTSKSTNMTSGNNASSVGLNSSTFEVLSSRVDGNGLYIGLNKDGTVRLYKGTTAEQGNTLTVNIQAAFNTYTIKSLTFKFGTAVAATSIKADGIEIHNGTPTASSTLVFNHLYASNFSISDIGTASIYIESIEITYLTHEQAAIDFADNVVNGVGNEAEGSCAAAYTELNGIFNALSPDSISFYNASTEELFVNAKARMAYLQAWVAANPTANPSVQLVNSSRNNLAAVITIGALGLSAILAYYFLNKKKLLG